MRRHTYRIHELLEVMNHQVITTIYMDRIGAVRYTLCKYQRKYPRYMSYDASYQLGNALLNGYFYYDCSPINRIMDLSTMVSSNYMVTKSSLVEFWLVICGYGRIQLHTYSRSNLLPSHQSTASCALISDYLEIYTKTQSYKCIFKHSNTISYSIQKTNNYWSDYFGPCVNLFRLLYDRI